MTVVEKVKLFQMVTKFMDDPEKMRAHVWVADVQPVSTGGCFVTFQLSADLYKILKESFFDVQRPVEKESA